jgi:hypothetical protein
MIDLKNRYQILETDLGPMISDSRSSVYDVMEMEEKGYDAAEIAMIFNLTPLQVQTALDYIVEHRERLTPILHELLHKKKEREAYYRAKQEDLRRKVVPIPAEKQALYEKFIELKKKNRARWIEEYGYDPGDLM